MSYRIDYSPQYQKRYPLQPKHRKMNGYLFVIVILAVIVSVTFFRSMNIREILLPGDQKMLDAAFDNMVVNLKNGCSIQESVAVFYQQVFEYVKLETVW